MTMQPIKVLITIFLLLGGVFINIWFILVWFFYMGGRMIELIDMEEIRLRDRR